jgi:adenosylcobinamide-GDP ribazoletransferase
MTDQPPTDRPLLARPWRRADDAILAVVFLTRIPLRLPGSPPDGALARAMGWFPLVGLVLGLTGAAVYALAGLAGLTPLLSALLALGAVVWLTGGLHEDGLADTFDGLGGGRERERKLEIMHDSRIGSYGALALMFSVGLRVAALAALQTPLKVALAYAVAASLSRAAAPLLAVTMTTARTDGLGFLCGRPPRTETAFAVGLAALIALVALGPTGMALPLAGALAASALVAAAANRHIGGYTGDVLGAAQQASEITILILLAASL